MCGIAGFCNLNSEITDFSPYLKDMTEILGKCSPNEYSYYNRKNIALGQYKSGAIDKNQHMEITYNNNKYILIYNGQLYNAKELRKELYENGFDFFGHSDTEILLNAFIFYGYDILKKLNGIFSFAIWNENNQELFLARDHFGIKPLFYSLVDNTLVFSSKVDSLLKFPKIKCKLDSQGISEIFGIGPAHTPGICAFNNIFEIKPAHFAVFNSSGLHIDRYWELQSRPHTDNFIQTCEKIRFLLDDSIKKQLVSDVSICSMLSGGLDSSIITAYASNYCKENNLSPLKTLSVDYVDNDINFVKSDFQPNSDNYYINIMNKNFNLDHKFIMIDTPELTNALENAVIARDFPGMADVDSSLLLFCKEIKKEASVALSGECSDEIFGGYPWFFRDDCLESNTFPWSIAISERQELLNPLISSKINLQEYVNFRYNESLLEVSLLDLDSVETSNKKKISYLTFNWFMQTLLDRSDRMSMSNGLEIRVPFCDYRIVDYMWNVPWEIKTLNGREKGLLRYIVKDLLPEEIVERKKSPYPKTHNPTYLKKVKQMLFDIINKKNSPINTLINKDYVLKIIESSGTSFKRPWFGQLMTGPQLMAYLCQVNMWLEIYKPEVNI